MEGVYNDLDSVKVELDKVNAEYRIKSELFESLKKVNDETLLKLEVSKQMIEKQSQELKVKCDEIAEVSQLVKKLETYLVEKDLSIKDLSSLNEKLKIDFGQKVETLEDENRDLGYTRNEVRIRNEDLEKDVDALRKQIDGLKSLLLVTESKCSEAERIAQEAKELRLRDVVVGELEDENAKFRNRLKWKEEQFQHLEEAHKKHQDEFRRNKEDWEREKLALVEESCSLNTRLDSQTRACEGLRTRLEMCNNALAHEESKRRSLEAQVSESESRFQNAVSHFEEESSEVQMLIFQRNKEITELRNLLGMKEIVAKEVELRISHLEQENQELRGSLKDLQEAQIRCGGTASSAKLHNKLRRLEQAYGNCSTKLKEKESELLFEIEKIREKAKSCESELEGKDEEVKKLRMELCSCHCMSLELNEEISIILEFLKSELSEAYSTTYNVKVEMELFNTEKDEKISGLTAQLEMSRGCLEMSRLELEKELKIVESLTERLKSFELMKQLLTAQEKLEQHKSNSNHKLDSCFGEDRKIFQNEKVSLFCSLQEKDDKLEDLSQKVVLLEGNLATKVEEKKGLAKIVEKEICIENLRNDFAALKREFSRRELEIGNLAQSDAAKDYAQEKETLMRVIAEKEQRIKNLKVLALSMERDLTSVSDSSFRDFVEQRVKIDALTEALKNHKYVTGVEIEEKNKRIFDQEESILSLKFEAEHLLVLIKCNKMETEKFVDIIKKLESDKRVLLLDNVKLSNENESLMSYIEKVCDGIGELSSEDVEVTKALGKILPRSDEKIEVENSFYGCVGEKIDSSFSTKKKKLEVSRSERSPLKEVNLMPR